MPHAPSANNKPNPAVNCARCLYALGFGYDRIARQLFGSNKRRHKIYAWKKWHRWPSSTDRFRGAIRARINALPPKPPKPPKRDPAYMRKQKRTKVYLRSKVWKFLKHGHHPKSAAALIGCDRAQFIAYLRPLLQPGMTFENYGPVWHLDHRVPCRFFNLHDPEQRRRCFHYSNLQPLEAHTNRTKAASLPPVHLLSSQLDTLSAISASAQHVFDFVK